MFRNKLIYRLFLILLVFAAASIFPIVFATRREMKELMEGINVLQVREHIFNSLITISFYVFILAFLLSLFFSRKLLLPVRELHRGAMSIRDGKLDVTLSPSSRDELGEVIEVFNEMASSLKGKTKELERKNREIMESRDFLEIIMDSIEDEILIIDRDYRVVRANKAVFEKSHRENTLGGPGFTEGTPSVIGEYCHVISHKMSRPCFLSGDECPVKEVFATGKTSRTIHQHGGIDDEQVVHEILACPIKDAQGNVINVIELLRNVTEVKLYEAALALKNRELTAINSIAAILSHSLDSGATIRNVVKKLAAMLDMDDGGIFIVDKDRKELVCSLTGRRLPLGGNIPSRAVETGTLHTIDNVGEEGKMALPWGPGADIRSCCCIPLKGREGILGSLYLLSCRPRVFSAEEKRILTSVGDMAGIALENTRLYDRINALYEYQRGRRRQEHDSLLSLSSRLASASDIKGAIDVALSLIADSFKADIALLLESDGNNRLILRSILSEYEDPLNLPDNYFGSDSVERQALERKRPVVVPAFSHESGSIRPLPLSESAVSVPISTGEKTLGVFSLYFKSPREFREEDIHFLEITSSILAVAIERSEFYEKMLAEKMLAGIVFESISDGLYTVDTDCVITSVNRAAEMILGIPAADLIGRKCKEVIIHKETGGERMLCGSECPLSSAIRGVTSTKDMDYIDPSGRRISVSVSCAPLINVDGTLIGAVEVFRDITKEKEIDRMKTEFVTTVSHEFRTPLSAIIGMTEMLIEREVDGDRAREYIETIQNEGKRLSDMVSDLLDISRIESGEEIFREGSVDFNEIFDDIKKTFSDIIGKKNIQMETRLAGEARGFRGDHEKVKQLLLNLVSNSINYSDKNCMIDVDIRAEGQTLKMEVADTGWGIPDDDLPLLTRKFFRGKHGLKTKGTGLGLSLCKDIAALHGGTLRVRSRLGRGTIVTVDFPLRKTENLKDNG
ncbi:MAG: GAF domain-containing protein [Nitrospirae bacterium]|nr:GAF domain-containing protein [Nitrospirota bacterium]MCL5422420.1 GAF domain-containing protein [Nitrospirota bacterium]